MTKAQSKVAVPPGNVVTRSVSNVTVCEPVEEVKMVSPEQPIPGGSGGGGGGGGGKIALASCTATAKGRPLHIGKHDLCSTMVLRNRDSPRRVLLYVASGNFSEVRTCTGLPGCETGGCNHPFSGTTVENLSELNSTYRHISGRG